MLIRWIGTEVRIFAYLQNAVLVVCSLGLGLYILALLTRPTLRRQHRFQRPRSHQSFARPHAAGYMQTQPAQRGGPSPVRHP